MYYYTDCAVLGSLSGRIGAYLHEWVFMKLFCVIVVFPFLVWLGASGTTTDKQSTKICKFLGDISYPVYVVHYPLMYLFYAWLIENKLYTLGETWYVAVGVFVLSVILACLCLKLYDEPVRKWLTKKFLAPK